MSRLLEGKKMCLHPDPVTGSINLYWSALTSVLEFVHVRTRVRLKSYSHSG
jgi:hypothetical protein